MRRQRTRPPRFSCNNTFRRVQEDRPRTDLLASQNITLRSRAASYPANGYDANPRALFIKGFTHPANPGRKATSIPSIPSIYPSLSIPIMAAHIHRIHR